MSNTLLPFSKKRVFVLRNSATAAEAARTMDEHRIGCVIVSDGSGHICGIVTDRDLACKIVAFQEDPNILLEQVMSTPVATIRHDQTLDDVIRVMKDCGIRRVPVIRKQKTGTEKCVGLITLDELVYRKLISTKPLAEILKTQVNVHHFKRAKNEQRRKHRQENTLNIFYKVLAREMKVSRPTAVAISGFLLTCVVERISPKEARHFISELPKILQHVLLDVEGPNRKITPRYILQRLDEDYGFDTRASYQLVRGFWTGLEFFLMTHQTEHVLRQLSKELQIFFTGEQYKKTRAPALAITHTSATTH